MIFVSQSTVCYFLLLIATYTFYSVHSLSTDECLDLGFNSLSLQCSTCDSMLRVVGDSVLHNDCTGCCQTPVSKATYQLAVLEVDKRFLTSFPNVKTFIEALPKTTKSKKKDSKKISKSIQVRYRFGVRPSLLLYNSKDDDIPADSISVSSWEMGALTFYNIFQFMKFSLIRFLSSQMILLTT